MPIFDRRRLRATRQGSSVQSKFGDQFHLRRIYLVLVASVVAVLAGILLFLLGTRPLADYDEAIYAQVAKEAANSRSPFAFTWKGNIGLGRSSGWYEKPPLIIWLTELGFTTIGPNEVSTRLPIALFSAATVVLSSAWAQAAFKSKLAAIFAASAFFTAFQFVASSSTLQLDIPVGFFILLSIYSFARAQHCPRYFYLFWLGISLGVLTKSVIGLLPLPIAFFASVLVRDHSYIRNRSFRLGMLVFLAVALPWHLIETIRFGKAFWDQYLVYHLLTRWSTGIEGNGQPFLFYWNILIHQRLLFALFIPSFAYVVYCARNGNMSSSLLATGTITLFIFFSSSHTKLPGYILPLYPFVTIAIGGFLGAACERLTMPMAKGTAVLVIAASLILGVKYTRYLVRADEADQRAYDSRAIGTYLRQANPQMDVYYLSEIGTKPSIVYYADRVVYYLPAKRSKPERAFLLVSEVKPPFASEKVIFQTPTQALYLIR